MSHYVYQLIDYKGYCFYIGYTKNLNVRIREHEMNKNASPAKKYRVRRSIKHYGYLKYTFKEFNKRKEALEFEAILIQKFKHQLVNKTHGKVKNEKKQCRSKGRSKQCPTCNNWYKRLGVHKCKK